MTKILDLDEVQFRQINPNFIDDGIPSSQAFSPTRKDEGKLSLDRSATVSAEAAHEGFLSRGLRSEAVFGLTPEEFAQGDSPVECFESPLDDNPNHSHADFNGLSKGKIKRKAKELKVLAVRRGCQFP